VRKHNSIADGAGSFRSALGEWTPERQPDLSQVMFVVNGDFIEFLPQRAHAVHAMHELEMAAALIVHADIIDDGVAHRFVDAPGDIQRHPRIVEPASPCILIHHPEHRTRLTEHSMDAIEKDGLAIGEVVQDIGD